MTQVIILEDTSRYDLGGGQRITLEAISCFQSMSSCDVLLYDVGCGQEFKTKVAEKKIISKHYCLQNTPHFFFKLPSITADILRAVNSHGKVYLYPATKKALILSIVIKMFSRRSIIIFHQHSRLGLMFDWLKIFANRVIIPGEISDKYNKKTIVIPNPIDISGLKKKYKQTDLREFALGFIGNLSIQKGFDKFVESQKANTLNSFVAGSGPLEHLVDKNTNYLGYININEKQKFYMDIDILVFPSIVEETFSLVCFEALFNFNPVVCFDIGYPAKIVKKYNVGVVAKSFTAKALNDAIQECIENIEVLSENCNKVISDFDSDNYCNDLAEIFN